MQNAAHARLLTPSSELAHANTLEVASEAVETPSLLAGPIMDLDASNIEGANGSSVMFWYDASGLGNDISALTVPDRPTLLTGGNGINGNSVVYFDGVDDWMGGPEFSAVEDGTIFMVGENDPLGPEGDGRNALWDWSHENGGWYSYYGGIYDSFGMSSQRCAYSENVDLLNVPHVWAIRAVGATCRYYINGYLRHTAARNGFDNYPIIIGKAGHGWKRKGSIAKILFYGRDMPDEEFNAQLTTLMTRYAISPYTPP